VLCTTQQLLILRTIQQERKNLIWFSAIQINVIPTNEASAGNFVMFPFRIVRVLLLGHARSGACCSETASWEPGLDYKAAQSSLMRASLCSSTTMIRFHAISVTLILRSARLLSLTAFRFCPVARIASRGFASTSTWSSYDGAHACLLINCGCTRSDSKFAAWEIRFPAGTDRNRWTTTLRERQRLPAKKYVYAHRLHLKNILQLNISK